ncbi:hypothetical protein [Cellulomonas sp. Y8]|uniref:hypothetical protein n=1 Tax=Cellulomonas sp. Y8 TaxID=2591145 RepID=UPI00143DBCED|nr:hypothetical protein [Cellulomonas sp. Y8]
MTATAGTSGDHVRPGAGTRNRSASALARYNARVAVDLDPRAAGMLRALLDPGAGGAAALRDLVGDDAHAHASAHAWCTSVITVAHDVAGSGTARPGAGASCRRCVEAARTATDLLGRAASVALPAHVQGLGAASALRSVVVLACADLDRCPHRDAVVASLTAPGSARVLDAVAAVRGAGAARG